VLKRLKLHELFNGVARILHAHKHVRRKEVAIWKFQQKRLFS